MKKGKMSNFEAEQLYKYYLSRLVKVNINTDKSSQQYVPFIGYKENDTLHLWFFSPKHLIVYHSNHEKNVTNPN